MADRIEGRDFFDLSEASYFNEISDPDVQQAFLAKLQTFDATHSAEEALREIGSSRGWSTQDEQAANALTADELYRLFKTYSGRELRQLVRGALYGNRVSGAERLKPLAAQAEIALRRIASESTLNRLRVQKFGIEINEEPEADD